MMRMRRFPRLVLVASLALTAFAAWSRPARAQVVVVTARSLDALIGEFRYLAENVGSEEDAKKVTDGLDKLKGTELLKGVDTTRPFGLFGSIAKEAGAPPTGTLFIPVTDGQAVLATLEQAGFVVQEDPGVAGFTHRITPPGGAAGVPLLAVLTKDYLLATTGTGGADELKALRPETLLPKTPGAGTLSVRLRLDQIPEEYKALVLGQIEQRLAAERDRKPGESDAEYQGRLAGMAFTQEAFDTLLKEAAELGLDLRVDTEAGTAAFELSMGATPGSKLAETVRSFGAARSLFRNIGKDAAFDGWANLPLSGPLRKAIDTTIQQGRIQAAKAAEEKDRVLSTKLIDALEPTLKGETFDLGAALYGPYPEDAGKTPVYAALVGLKVKDGAKIEAFFREAVSNQDDEDKKKAKVSLDFVKASPEGPAVHKVELLEKNEGDELFGKADLYLSVRDDVILLSLGSHGQDVLKDALARTADKAPAGTTQLELAAFLKRVAPMTGDDDEERAAAKEVAAETFVGEDADKDAVRLRVGTEGDYLRISLTADVPALSFLAAIGDDDDDDDDKADKKDDDKTEKDDKDDN
ncbi:hypothetical protein EP7_000165 [Isosphaeraceae bacterium EP7]